MIWIFIVDIIAILENMYIFISLRHLNCFWIGRVNYETGNIINFYTLHDQRFRLLTFL